MRRTAAVGTAVVVLLLAAAAFGAGAAAATKLTLSEHGIALTPGENVYAEGPFRIVTSEGPVENCTPYVELFLHLLTNSKARDELEIDDLHTHAYECQIYGSGNVAVSFDSLGGFLKVSAQGKAFVGPDPTLRLEFERAEYEGVGYEDVECVYRRATLAGTNTATPSPHTLGVALEGALELRASLSSPKAKRLCPAEAELSFSFPEIEGETGTIEEQTGT